MKSKVSHVIILFIVFQLSQHNSITLVDALMTRTRTQNKETIITPSPSTTPTYIYKYPSVSSSPKSSSPHSYNIKTPSFSFSSLPSIHNQPTLAPSTTPKYIDNRKDNVKEIIRPENINQKSITAIEMLTTTYAKLYINGEIVATVIAGKVIIPVILQTDDVIAVHASGFVHGAISISLRVENAWHFVASNVIRGTLAGNEDTDKFKWFESGYKDSCAWSISSSVKENAKIAELQNIVKDGRCSSEYSSYNEFVWVEGDKMERDVYMRVLIGGECGDVWNCSGSKCENKNQITLPKLEDSKDRCMCRKSMDLNDGDSGQCYSFTGRVSKWKGGWKRVCERKKCSGAEYECVGGVTNTVTEQTVWCMRKYRIHEIKKVQNWYGGLFLCDRVRISQAKSYLVPIA